MPEAFAQNTNPVSIFTSQGVAFAPANEAKQDTGNSSLASVDSKVSTATKQDTGNASLNSLDTKVTACNTNSVTVSASALPTGAAVSAKQDTANSSLSSIDSKVSTSALQSAGNTSLSSLDSKVTAVNTNAVVVSSSALPSGGATSAKQDTGNTSLSSIDSKLTTCNTGAVVVSSSALPSGASTSALQSTGNSSVASIDTKIVLSSASNLAAQSSVNAQLVNGPGQWAVNHVPSANVQATISKAAVASTRHVCTGISVSLNSNAALTSAIVTIQLRDGASGAGTVLWSVNLSVAAGVGSKDSIHLSGLNIVGSLNTAMTLEFTAAAGTNISEAVSLTGYDAA